MKEKKFSLKTLFFSWSRVCNLSSLLFLRGGKIKDNLKDKEA